MYVDIVISNIFHLNKHFLFLFCYFFIFTVAESLSRDLVKVSELCDLWGMRLASKTKTIIVSRSRTMHPQSPALTIGGTVLK